VITTVMESDKRYRPLRALPPTSTAAVLAGFVALVLVAHRWGNALLDSGRALKVGVPPLHAEWDLHITRDTVVVLVVGAVLLVVTPLLATRASWRGLMWSAPMIAAVWTVTLNATRGAEGFVHGIDNRHEYLSDVDAVGAPFSFLRGFTDDFDGYATHTQGHPPGFVIVLWVLRALGLGGAGWAAALCIAAGATAVVAVLVAVRDVAGEAPARAAAPFMALAPVALWVATSADAFFALLAACAAAAMVRAVVRPRDRSIGAAVVGGTCFGLALLCSYGLVLIAVTPGVLAIRFRRLPALAPAAIAAGAVLLLAFAAGFQYLEGLQLTRRAYFDGVASVRPYGYALVANLAAFAIALGPAIAVGITRTRGRLALLVGGALLAVLLADVSGMSKLEVERIWLPFALWVLPAGAALTGAGGARMTRGWLALQMGFALVIQTTVRTGW
jgi:methylthioxylose transferase